MTNNSVGSTAEIFDYFSAQPILNHSKEDTWLAPPIPIESYSLLEMGDFDGWRIIERDPDFVPGDKYKSLLYVYGTPPNGLIATDIYDNEKKITEREAKELPEYYAHDDFYFKKSIMDHLAKIKH